MTAIPNQTNVNLTTIFPNLGGGGSNTSISSFANLFADNAQISTLGVSSFTAYGGFSTNVITIPPGGQINLDQANLNLLYNDSTSNASALFIQWHGTLEAVPYASIQYYDEVTSTIRFQSFDYVKGTPTDDPATAILSQEIRCSSFTVSSINGAELPSVPKMNWGAITIPASGSTVASVADNPYSGPYYQQLTYRGNVQAGLSSLFASSINGNSFFVYGEPGQQVMYQTIGYA